MTKQTFFKFPKIVQFNDIKRELSGFVQYQCRDEDNKPIYDKSITLPSLVFRGTVKLHGTNASVVVCRDGTYYAQSRNRTLSLEHDNAGFCIYALKNEVQKHFKKDADAFFTSNQEIEKIVYYGEWCGANVQKGVALSEIGKKVFALFAVSYYDSKDELIFFLPLADYDYLEDHSLGIYTAMTVDNLLIDFNNPEGISKTLDELTKKVEDECPFTKKYFDISGIGEGIVWTASLSHQGETKNFLFKTKGDKHSNSKVKTFDASKYEGIEKAVQFANNFLTESRLNQGLEYLREMEIPIESKSTGDFLRWIVNDIMEEEKQLIIENEINVKVLNKTIACQARNWFFKQI